MDKILLAKIENVCLQYWHLFNKELISYFIVLVMDDCIRSEVVLILNN